jgi:uncharacterized protein
MIERRITKGAEVRAKKKGEGDDAKRTIEGYGAVFNQDYILYESKYCRVIERVNAGAFTRTLKAQPDVRCSFNHNPDNVLGRTSNGTLQLAQDDKGLSYATDLDARTHIAQDVYCFVDRGDVTGSSFSFNVRKETWTETIEDDFAIYLRVIEDVDLHELGPVLFPAYEGTSVGARGHHARLGMELRSAAWAEELPAEIRAKIAARAKKEDDDSSECGCPCVACARDNDCDNCVDHMVDCGDEENCSCMSKRSSAPAKEERENVVDIERVRLSADVDHRLRNLGLPTT